MSDIDKAVESFNLRIRKIETMWVITSPDYKGLYLCNEKLCIVLGQVEEAINLIEKTLTEGLPVNPYKCFETWYEEHGQYYAQDKRVMKAVYLASSVNCGKQTGALESAISRLVFHSLKYFKMSGIEPVTEPETDGNLLRAAVRYPNTII